MFINIPQRQYQTLKNQIDTAVLQVLESDRWLMGGATANFAKEFATYIGVEYCLPVANGTDALEIALRSIQAPQGAGCITVANAGGYTSTACTLVGLTPQYIDIDPTTLLMDIEKLPTLLRDNTKVIVVTHLYGNIVDVQRIQTLLQNLGREDIVIIEDCAQAHGGVSHGRKVGSIGDIGTFSFYPTKNLGALGDGGAIVTNSENRFTMMRQLHQYGWSSRYHNDIPLGRNSRMDEIQAAILSVKLSHLDAWNRARCVIVQKYAECLPQSWQMKTQYEGGGVCHLAVLEAPSQKEREILLERLREKEIIGDVHYPVLDCDQNAWKYTSECLDNLDNSRRVVSCIVTLPCFPEMTDEEIQNVITVIKSL